VKRKRGEAGKAVNNAISNVYLPHASSGCVCGIRRVASGTRQLGLTIKTDSGLIRIPYK